MSVKRGRQMRFKPLKRHPQSAGAQIQAQGQESIVGCSHPCKHVHQPNSNPRMVLCKLCGAPVADLLSFQDAVGKNFHVRYTAFLKAWMANSEQSASDFFMVGKTSSESGNAGAELPEAPGQSGLHPEPATTSKEPAHGSTWNGKRDD